MLYSSFTPTAAGQALSPLSYCLCLSLCDILCLSVYLSVCPFHQGRPASVVSPSQYFIISIKRAYTSTGMKASPLRKHMTGTSPGAAPGCGTRGWIAPNCSTAVSVQSWSERWFTAGLGDGRPLRAIGDRSGGISAGAREGEDGGDGDRVEVRRL